MRKKRKGFFIIFLTGLILFSWGVFAELPAELDTERCEIFSASCPNFFTGCSGMTGNSFCEEKGLICGTTDSGGCDIPVDFWFRSCENCVLCCDYNIEFFAIQKDTCRGPGVVNMLARESVDFAPEDPNLLISTYTDFCVDGTENLVKKHLCDPERVQQGCEPPIPALVVIFNKHCPTENPVCFDGKCVECKIDSDCDAGKKCDATNKCVDNIVCDGVSCTSACENSCVASGKHCFNGSCAECRVDVPADCTDGKICNAAGVCAEPIALPCPRTCTTATDCTDCCSGLNFYHGTATCNSEVCSYTSPPFPCPAGGSCSANVGGCCGTLGEDCCDTGTVCYNGLSCDAGGKCRDTCTAEQKDKFRCDVADTDKYFEEIEKADVILRMVNVMNLYRDFVILLLLVMFVFSNSLIHQIQIIMCSELLLVVMRIDTGNVKK